MDRMVRLLRRIFAPPGAIRMLPVTWLAAACAYLVLDQISNIDPATRFGFTLWNPPAGLAISLGFAFAWRAVPAILAGAVAAGIVVRDLPFFDPAMWFAATVMAIGYTAVGVFLRSRAAERDPFGHPLDTLAFMLAAVLGAGIVVGALMAGLAAGASLDPTLIVELTIRTWIGDATGIAVLLPLLLRVRGAIPLKLRAPGRADVEPLGAGILACVLAGLASLGPEASIGIAYLTLLPVVWIAVRFGLNATVLAVTGVQIVIASVATFDERGGESFADFQVMMIVIALTGPILGAAIEHARGSAEDLARLRVDSERLARLTSVGALGSIMAHELSQPLSAVRAASHVLTRSLATGQAAPEVRRAAATIEAQVEAASARIRTLRAEFQTAGPDAVEVDLIDVARAAARVAAAERTGPSARIRIDASRRAVAFADRQHVAHILLNIFRNALAATAPMGDGASVRVSFATEAPDISVLVEDDGPGVPAELGETLFEPMASGRPDGVGLGLFIGKTLAGLNGGDLVLAPSRNGRGATFILTLPGATS